MSFFNNDDALCATCSEINFGKYFQEAIDSTTDAWGLVGPNPGALRIGTIKQVTRRRGSCAFCRIVVAAVCTKRLLFLTSPEKILSSDRDEDLLIYSYCFLATVQNAQNSFRIGVSIGPPGRYNNPRLHHAGDIQLNWNDAQRVCESRLGYGRMIKAERLDMSLPRLWMNTCLNSHGSSCDLPDLENIGSPTDLLCVDVERGCISDLPQGARYCTLSYCWLSQRVLTLIKANRDEFMVPGSLTKLAAELPSVIADALEFVKELGERWIWIDSLCIIQDDDDHKQHQIAQMDKVYGSSFLGIIAAKCTTNDALDNSGLARYSSAPRCRPQHVTKVGDLTMMVPFESIDSLIQQSRYDRRQWTYQEWILPRRLIFFTDSQVYFRCPCSTFCEDSVGEEVPPSTTFTPVSNMWNPTSPHIEEPSFEFGIPYLPSGPYNGVRAATLAMRHFTTHVDTFTIRELTFEEDTLNAFLGVQNILGRHMKTRFWCGLPERYLDRLMLWVPWGVARRRMKRDKSLGYAFPSWSWAGWTGHMSYSYLWMTSLHCEVAWYIANKRGETVKLITEGLPGDTPFAINGRERAARLLAADAAIRSDKSLTLLPEDVESNNQARQNYHQLIGWTTICQFHLINQKQSWGGHEQVFRHATDINITDNSGTWVGSILIDKTWITTHELEKLPLFDFIVLSRSDAFDLGTTFEQRSPTLFDESILEPRSWCILNVMLVERHDDCFERVAVGVIHEDAWAVIGPTFQLVKLV